MASWRRKPTPLSDTWTVYRQAGAGYPPLWHRGSQRQPTDQPEGRWHEGGRGHIVQYTSLDIDGAWAELVRYEGIRTEQQRLDASIRVRLWQLTIQDTKIADLSTFDLIEATGLDPERIVAEKHDYCHSLADELRAAGYHGVLAPSAAMPGVVNLSLFGPRREVPAYQLRMSGRVNPNPGYFIPVQLAADDAAPPQHVLDHTCHFGDPHWTLQQWLEQKKT